MSALFIKDLRAQLLAELVIMASILAFLLLGIPAVRSMGTTIYDSMPEALLALAGIPAGADVEVMAYSQMIGLLGSLSVAGFAVAVGAGAIAGEERGRTLSLLLGQPISRLALVATKALTLVITVVLSCFGLWAAGLLARMVFRVDLGEAHLGGLCLALGANALFCGAVSFALGSVTGSRGLASGIGSVVLALGWLLASLLPMSPETAEVARFVPWYWYTKPMVLVNGIDAGYLGLSLGFATGLLLIGVIGFPLRDLRSQPLRLLPKLPVSTAVGGDRSINLAGLIAAQHLGLLIVIGVIMFAIMGVYMGPIYQQMAPELVLLNQTMPPELMRMWGAGDMSTPAGFFWGETMGIMAPAAVITVATVIAATLTQDEHSGRLGLLLSTPRPRWRVFATFIGVQITAITIIAALTGLGIWGGVQLADLDLADENIAAASIHLLALGLFSAAVASLAAAIRLPVAWTVTGVAMIGYVINVTLPMAPEFADWARISPFYWYSAAQPLAAGINWGHVGVLLGVSALILAVSFPLFARRDLRV